MPANSTRYRRASGALVSGSIACSPAPCRRVRSPISICLLRPVYGHAKQGAPYGHTKIVIKQVRCKACPRWSPAIVIRYRRPC